MACSETKVRRTFFREATLSTKFRVHEIQVTPQTRRQLQGLSAVFVKVVHAWGLWWRWFKTKVCGASLVDARLVLNSARMTLFCAQIVAAIEEQKYDPHPQPQNSLHATGLT